MAVNVPDKRVQNDVYISSAEREEQVTKAQPKGNVPALRFPEFTEEWESVLLEDVAEFQKKRISSDLLNNSNYISTENILQNFGGVQNSISIPANTNVIEYQKGDVLLSNIRPYLKKVWLSDRHGGCSADVFVLRGNQCERRFLYYVIASDRFINFVMSGAKGVKMPRGDKSQMEKFAFFIPTNVEQKKIARFLSMLDERIRLQNKIIEKLETLIKGICNKSLYTVNGTAIQLGDILIERRERTVINNQYEVLSSTVKGIFSQREYFSKDIASENNVGYKIIRLHDVVLSPQNLWMGNVNYNDNFEVGIVSPSYKVFSIAENLDKRYIATLLKTHRALYNYMLVSEQGASIVRRNLNMEAFEQITFKIPPLSKQEKIGNAISILQARITSAIRIKTAYEAQKQWLLTQMFI